MFSKCLENVRSKSAACCITNYVTVNDVANVILACGAKSRYGGRSMYEAGDITAIYVTPVRKYQHAQQHDN